MRQRFLFGNLCSPYNLKKLYNLVYGEGYFRCCFSRLDGRDVQLGGKKRLVGKKYVSSWKNFSP